MMYSRVTFKTIKMCKLILPGIAGRHSLWVGSMTCFPPYGANPQPADRIDETKLLFRLKKKKKTNVSFRIN